MSAPVVDDLDFDVESLLQPISENRPAGEDLRYEPEYDTIKKARRSDDDSVNRGVWVKDAKVADWGKVIEDGGTCLRTKTKDLQIAAWMTEALGRIRGFAGLRDGFHLLRGLQERFWETYYPNIEDGELDSRFGPFQFMNDPIRGLPAVIATTPLTDGSNGESLPYRKFLESRDSDNKIKINPAAAKSLAEDGKIVGKDFDKIVTQTSKAFYVRLVLEIRQAVEAFKAFESATDEKFGRMSPSLLNVGKALGDCLAWAEPILAQKRLIEPDPVIIEEPVVKEDGAKADDEAVQVDAAVSRSSPTVSVPTRKVIVPIGPDHDAPDYGRLLIEFQERARQLAEAGVKLKANREKYSELLAELKKLDEEYDAVSKLVSQSREGYQLISQLAKLTEMSP